MKKKYLLISFLCIMGFTSHFASAQQPNILVIISDDHNTNTISCYGGNIETPALDRLANEGVRYTRAYTNAALCVPTRYTCLTGAYASRSLHRNYGPLTNQASIANGAFFTENEKTIAMALQNAGYYTGVTGKWHNASKHLGIDDIPKNADPRDPEVIRNLREEHGKLSDDIRKYGFDYANYLTYGNLSLYPDELAHHNVEYTVKGAIEFLERTPEDKPFFLWTAFTTTHGPHERIDIADVRMTPEGYTEKHLCYRPEIMPSRAEIIAECKNPDRIMEQMVKWMDEGIDIILKKLDDMGISDNTIVFFLSDQQNIGKSTLYECGQNIAFLTRYPNLLSGGEVSNSLIDITDMAATILDVSGAEPLEDMQLDGESMLPLWNGNKEQLKTAIFSEMGVAKAVVTKDFKYIAIRYPDYVLEKGIPPESGDVKELAEAGKLEMLRRNTPFGQKQFGIIDPDQLYDLRNDPDEKVNLAKDPEYADILEEMKFYLSEYIKEIGRPFGEFNNQENE